MLKKHDAIETCLRLIEGKLNWGESKGWSNYDFGKLGDIIQEKTGVLLSTTTLKRLWGRLKYDSLPSVTTLNTLACFLDYADWRAFCQQGMEEKTSEDRDVRIDGVTPGETSDVGVIELKPTDTKSDTSLDPRSHGRAGKLLPLPGAVAPHARPSRRQKQYWFVIAIAVLVIIGLYSLTNNRATDRAGVPAEINQPDADQFFFKADKIIGEGVPNSVIFSYDAKAATTDSVYIVQTWDISRKTLVPRTGTHHSAIYYYPGFFRTKLIADGRVMKSHVLQITSNGWLCLAEAEPAPIYFRKEQYLKKDRVEVDSNALKAFNLSLYPKPPRIRFFHQGDMGELMNDNFVFQTTIRNAVSSANVCQKVEVLIQCKDDIIIIPLTARACVGDLRLYAAGAEANSKTADLSKFGCDLNEWTTLKVETVDQYMTFYVNGTKAYSFTFPNPATGIVGVQYRFNGPAAVKDTRFTNKGKVYRL